MYDKKHRIRNSYILISLLAGVCWILALTAILFQLSDTSANAGSAVPAYSSHSPVYSNTNFRLNAVSEHTYELTPKDSVKTNNISIILTHSQKVPRLDPILLLCFMIPHFNYFPPT